ncbi:MAG: hypothetical protein LUG98_02735 [Tannerellaceae bacterium]|nr:hypothetical protein [Tannerellaceae bacterium]
MKSSRMESAHEGESESSHTQKSIKPNGGIIKMTKLKSKRLLSLLLSLAMVFALTAAPVFAADTDTSGITADTSWYNTTDTSFTISDAADLAGLAAIVNGTAYDSDGNAITADSFSGKTVTLAANIDLDSNSLVIADSSTYMFAGTFDGGGYTISNMSCQLFGYVSAGATIENVTLNITSSATYAGLAGIVYGSEDSVTTISGVTVTGTMTGASAGLIASAYSSGTATSGTVKETEILIQDCTNKADITTSNTSGIGGIVNLNSGTSVYFLNCTNEGTLTAGVDSSVTKEVHIGGIVRYVNGGTAGTYKTTLENCVNTGTITTTQNGSDTRTNVGGMISTAQGGEFEFINCSNSGAVSGTINNSGSGSACVGALAGKWNGYTCTATGFTNTGDITATGSGSSNKAYAGGVVGYTDNSSKDHTIVGATVSGEITATSDSTALAGYAIGYISKANTTTTLAVNYIGTDEELPIVGGMNSSMSDSDITYGVALVYDNAGDYAGYYNTLKAAVSAASDEDKIILIADVDSTTLYSASNKALTLDLAGHSLSVTSGYALQISQYASGTLTIMDSIGTGTIESTAKSALYVGTGSLDIVVNGGNFVSSTAYDIYNGGTGTVTITNGTFTSGSYAIKNASTGTFVISGGYYSDYHTLSTYLADGYAVGTQITDTSSDYYNMYPVVAAAFVVSYSDDDGNNVTESYATLYQAWSALSSGYTDIVVTMNSDSEQYFKVDSDISATLDLNGYSIEYSGNAVQVNGTLTITDSSDTQEGTITSTSESNGVAAVHIYEGGSVTVENGTVSGRIAVLTESTGTASIAGGNIDGTLSGSITATGGCLTSDPSDYVADGYISAEITDDTYNYTVLSVDLGASGDDSTEVTATSISGYGTNTLYAGVSASDISSCYSTSSYPTASLTFTDNDGEEHTYIFAGWYSYDDDNGYTALKSFPTGDAYAKFVDADVLSVKVGVAEGTDGDTGYYWRFVTGLDTLNYSSAGFEAYLENNETKIEFSKIYYWTYYTVESQGYTFYGSDFGSCGKYIATALYNSSDTPTTCKVRAYWVTLDGTTVYGDYENLTYTSGTYLLNSAD